VNGVSQGVKSKTDECLHAAWRVVYEPGEVEVVARKDGKETARKSVRTAGEPAKIRLTGSQYGEGAGDDALMFVTVEITDAEGNLCPLADNLVHFELDGDSAFIAGVDNGSPISMERFKDNQRKAFYGKCLVVLQASKAGKTELKATSDGLEVGKIVFFSSK
jgi:beta-galactosidase